QRGRPRRRGPRLRSRIAACAVPRNCRAAWRVRGGVHVARLRHRRGPVAVPSPRRAPSAPGRAALAALAAALTLTAAAPPAPAAPRAHTARRTVTAALVALSKSGAIQQPEYTRYASAYVAAKRSLRKLSGTRRVELGAVLANVQAMAAAGLFAPTRLPAL